MGIFSIKIDWQMRADAKTRAQRIFSAEPTFPKNLNRFYQIIDNNYHNLFVMEGWEKMADNSVFIGNKPFMNYVTGVVMQFTTKNAQEVVIKARGKFISRAVDVAEVTSKRFLDNAVGVSDIKIDSEGFKNNEGKDVRVSTIEITFSKNR
jgi:DNA-binding protein